MRAMGSVALVTTVQLDLGSAAISLRTPGRIVTPSLSSSPMDSMILFLRLGIQVGA